MYESGKKTFYVVQIPTLILAHHVCLKEIWRTLVDVDGYGIAAKYPPALILDLFQKLPVIEAAEELFR